MLFETSNLNQYEPLQNSAYSRISKPAQIIQVPSGAANYLFSDCILRFYTGEGFSRAEGTV